MGIKGVPIGMDGEGMKPETLEKVINSWDEGTRGRRPRVLYTVPVGQNPVRSIFLSSCFYRIFPAVSTETGLLCDRPVLRCPLRAKRPSTTSVNATI